jgi:hypothetical protein
MLRKTVISLLAVASVGLAAPPMALARGGGGGGGGGGHGGGFGGGGGFHGGGFGGGSFHGGFAGGNHSGAAFHDGGFRGGEFRGGRFGEFRGRGFHDRDFGRRHFGFEFGYPYYDYYDDYAYDYPYGYYPYASSDSYADNGSCYVVQRRAAHYAWLAPATPSGVRLMDCSKMMLIAISNDQPTD